MVQEAGIRGNLTSKELNKSPSSTVRTNMNCKGVSCALVHFTFDHPHRCNHIQGNKLGHTALSLPSLSDSVLGRWDFRTFPQFEGLVDATATYGDEGI
jgi:hypothetical protein